jgi:putative hydroxymethylpyrimidine transport system substrate-binding protein
MRKSCYMAMLVAGMALALAGCGASGDQGTTASSPVSDGKVRPLRVTLAGRIGPEGAGLIMAKHLGYFADEGLEVYIVAPGRPSSPVKYVIEGEDDVGVAPQPQLVLAKEKGAQIAAIGSVIPQATGAMMWLKNSKIDGIADLKGKTIAIPGLSFERSFLEAILARGGLTLEDVKVKAVDYELVWSLSSGQADAIFGGSSNMEGVMLESMGLDPVVTPVGSLGIPPYEEQVLFTRTHLLEQYPQLSRDFMSAVRRGTAAAIQHPKTVARLISKDFERDFETGREETEAQLKATLPLLSRSGSMSPARAEAIVDWMYDEEMIQEKPTTSELFAGDYLPK